MRVALYALLALAGAVIALLGEEPLWLPAVVALLVFPIAAMVSDRESRPGRRLRTAPVLPAALTALSGGLLTALALRLAVDAPGWFSSTAAACGAVSTEIQQLVLWFATFVFIVAAVPVAVTTLTIGRRLRPGDHAEADSPPIALYPVAVAVSGMALIAASYVTNC